MTHEEKLDSILGVAPEATKTAIEEASDILNAEVIEAADASNTALITASPAEISVIPEAKPKPKTALEHHNEDLSEDVTYARSQIKDLIDQGRLAVNGALELAEAGDSPRAYEVVATMITAVVQANKELVQIHKTKKDATRETVMGGSSSGVGNTVNIDKAVFIGNSNNLLREIKAARIAAAEALKECSSDAQPQALESTDGEKS